MSTGQAMAETAPEAALVGAGSCRARQSPAHEATCVSSLCGAGGHGGAGPYTTCLCREQVQLTLSCHGGETVLGARCWTEQTLPAGLSRRPSRQERDHGSPAFNSPHDRDDFPPCSQAEACSAAPGSGACGEPDRWSEHQSPVTPIGPERHSHSCRWRGPVLELRLSSVCGERACVQRTRSITGRVRRVCCDRVPSVEHSVHLPAICRR